MTSSFSSESDKNRSESEQKPDAYLVAMQDIQQQQAELRTDVERIHQSFDRFKGFFQTLVSGLVITVLVAFGIAIWYAYRSFSEQQAARQMAEETAVIQDEIIGRVNQLEESLQQLEQDFPEQLGDVSDEIQSSQADLRRLRTRLEAVSAELETINLSDNTSDDANNADSSNTSQDNTDSESD